MDLAILGDGFSRRKRDVKRRLFKSKVFGKPAAEKFISQQVFYFENYLCRTTINTI